MKPRSITTSNQFAIRLNRPAASVQSLNFKRWASDEATRSEEAFEGAEDEVNKSDAQEQNTVSSAISQAAESVQDMAASASGAIFKGSADPFGLENRPAPVASPTIYVGNLSFEIAPEDLKREFESFGEIKMVKIATDGKGLSKG